MAKWLLQYCWDIIEILQKFIKFLEMVSEYIYVQSYNTILLYHLYAGIYSLFSKKLKMLMLQRAST